MTFTDVPFEERGQTPEARVLLAALHTDRSRFDDAPIGTLTPEQWDALVTIAGDQRVRPLLHQRLHETGQWQRVPQGTWQRLDAQCKRIAMRKILLHAELQRLLAALSDLGVPAIPLKGSYLGPRVYGNVGLREMDDLDVLVKRGDLGKSLALAQRLGFEAKGDINTHANEPVDHHLERLSRNEIGLELHWTLVPTRFASMAVDPDDFWRRSEPPTTRGSQDWSLAPVDHLLHLCFHTSFHHQFEFGLRPSCDIVRLIAVHGGAIDWDDLRRTAEARGWSRGVSLALAVAANLFGAPVPAALTWLVPRPQLSLALKILWTGQSEARATSPRLAPLARGVPPQHRLRYLLGRLQATRLRELPGLLSRHGRDAVALAAGSDKELGEAAGRRNSIRDWMLAKTEE